MSDIEKRVANIALTDIHADAEFNCRGQIAPMDVADLANDIKINGLIQPVVVSPYDEEMKIKTGCNYMLVAGFRRYIAHKINQMTHIDCIIRTGMDDIQARFFNLSENIQRQDLTILQEANALKKLKDMGVTETMTADMLPGKSRGWVQIRFMLLALPPEIQVEAEAKFINQTSIRKLYTILKRSGKEACMKAAVQVKEAKITGKKKQNLDISKHIPTSKRLRSRPEIFDLQDHIRDSFGNGLATRVLAWAAGEINDIELQETLSETAEIHDIKTYQSFFNIIQGII